jgi:LIVCS family branched-chain amino acid:cation transporter
MKPVFKVTDILALGFMTFAFFLGAGNIIFPPLAGQLAGNHLVFAMLGFLITAVGLPLIGIVAVAVGGGGWQGLTQDLPPKIATIMAVMVFIVIGPAFAAPRTGLVAYEMTIKPWLSDPNAFYLAIFSVAFFALALFFSWSQGKLIDLIGKFLTPVLFLVLTILAIAVFISPQDAIQPPQGQYIDKAFVTGFLEGYNTMDIFASLMFGMLIVDVIRKKGVSDARLTCRYLIFAGVIAACGLAFVYVSLFYLGATSNSLVINAANGGVILAAYVQALFGSTGQLILSSIVFLACLTTAVGLISACSDYFSRLNRFSYRQWAVAIAIICAVITNVGLTQLISLSIPVLFALYPVVVSLVLLTFLRRWMKNSEVTYRSVLLVALLFSLIDAGKAAGMNVRVFDFLPGFSHGMAWVIPTVVCLVICFFLPKRRTMVLTPIV